MINKAVLYMLKNDSGVTDIVGSKTYPVVMPEETQAPCLVFLRSDLTVEYDKASGVVDTSGVEIIMFSKDYVECVNLALAVRSALESKKGTFNGVEVILSRLRRAEEGYDVDSDTFYQKLTFIFKSSNI